MRHKGLFFVIIIISTAIKLYHAYISSFYIIGDTSITALMAREFLKGNFPLFFYGGFYTIPVESWFIALFFFLFGISSYTLHLGPIFVSILFIISTYFLGKELKDAKVGLLALVYSAFPPLYLFKSGVTPIGYLIELIFLGNLIILFTWRVCRKGYIYFILLGAVGGVAFWTHYIALYYLVGSFIFITVNLAATKRFRYLALGGFVGLCSFFIIALPWWYFCITHDFICFKFPQVGDTSDALSLLKRFFLYQLPGILGGSGINLILYVISFLFCLRRRKNLLFLLIFISMAVFFCLGGKFATTRDHRYVLPIFSIMPVAVAYFLDWLDGKKKYLGAVILYYLVLSNCFQIVKGISIHDMKHREDGSVQSKLMGFLAKNNIDGVYGMAAELNIINFLGKERIYASQFWDSDTPFDENTLAGNRIAYINIEFLKPILDMLCKSYSRVAIGPYSLFFDLKPWGYYGEEMKPIGWKARSNYNSKSADWAFDRNMDRYWSSIIPKKSDIYYEIEFPEVYKIYKFQVFNMSTEFSYRNFPKKYRFSVSLDGVRWKSVLEGPAAGMFWSGPQVLWRQRDSIWEVIFHPVKARFVRIENLEASWHNTPWEINEIIFYRYIGKRECTNRDYVYNAKEVYEYIKDKDIGFVYTDYWLSEKIRRWSKGSIQALRIYNNFWPDRTNTSRFVKLDKGVAIVVNRENEKAVEKILAEIGIRFKKICIGDYICFCFEEDISIESLYWTGAGISRINLRAFGKLLLDSGDYLKAVKYFPANPNLRYRLLEMYRKNGRWDLYKREKQFIRHRFSPSVEKNVKFNKGIEFLGLNWQQLSGDIYRINYFWRLDENLREKVFVFVHFIMDGKIIFQNDHPLLGQFIKLPILLPDEVWKESYIIKIPMSAPRGRYTIKLGLWNGSKRLRISGSKSTSVSIDGIEIGKNRLLKGLKGRIVFQSNVTGNTELYMMNADGGNVKRITHTDKDSSYANWSPDARDIVFMSNRNGNNEIYIIDSNGENLRNLTNSSAGDINPSWHPDGNRIIFVSDREGAMNFYLIDKDGSNLTKITDFVDGVHDMPRISPDGEEIIFTSNMSMGWQIFKVDLDGKNLQRVSDLLSGHCEGIWARRSNKILFVSRLGGNSDIYVMDRDGSNEQRLITDPALDYNPRFSPDDKKIIFSSERDGNWELYVMSIDDYKPVRITYTDAQEEWPDYTDYTD